jgi:hypothetical protein
VVNVPDRRGLHRLADVRSAPGTLAVVLTARTPRCAANSGCSLADYDGGAALPDQDEPFACQRAERMLERRRPHSLQLAEFPHRRQRVAGSECARADSAADRLGDLPPGGAAGVGLFEQLAELDLRGPLSLARTPQADLPTSQGITPGIYLHAP